MKASPARTSSLRSSRGSNLHCVPVLADRARAWRQNKNGRETTSGQKIISPRCFARARRGNIGARRCLSPRTKAIAPRGFARCKPPALPGQNTRAVIFKAAPFAVSRCRVTLGKVGPRRLPRSLAPTARFIEI